MNSKKRISGKLPEAQSGAVLVLGLVLLTVLTIVGVSSMSSSTMELQMAGNQQAHNKAFQAAQSRLSFASNDDPVNPIDFLIAIPDVTNPATYPVQTCDPGDGCPDGPDWSATATVNYLDCQIGIGSSLEAGKGFSFRVFQVQAQAQSGNARSIQTSALRYPVKGCGDEML